MISYVMGLLTKVMSPKDLAKVKLIIEDYDKTPRLELDTHNLLCGCDGKTYMLKVGKDIVARACVHKFTWYGREIRHLFVPEQFRRKGYAEMINKELFKLHKVPFFFATVRVDNEPSRKLFAKIGFKTYDSFISAISKQKVEFICFKMEDYLNEEDRNTVDKIEENM